MTIAFSGTYSAENLRRFDRAARKALGSSNMYMNAGCFGAAAIVLLILAIVQWTRGNELGAFEWLMCFVIAGVAAPMQWWSTRRAFGRHPNLNQTLTGELRDDAINVRTPTSETTIAWNGFSASFCNEDYLILVGTTNSLYGLSIDFFRSADEFRSACEMVRRLVPAQPAGLSPRKRIFRILGWIVFVVLIFLVWSLLQTSR